MMTDRYEQVFHICYDALQIETDQRAAFLDLACDGDALLRRAVESLLANEERAESFLVAPALAVLVEQMAEELGWEKTTLQSNDRQPKDAYSPLTETRVEPLMPGLILDGRYAIEKELEQGGIGLIYLAHDRKLRNRVVIKTLMERTRAKSERKWIEEKFRQEIEVVAQINHPGVVGALDVGALPDGRTYLVMQYIPGPSLRAATAIGKMDMVRVGSLIRQLGHALAAVHEHNVIHRDLKPENILLQQSGGAEYAKIIDFGIAKVLAELSATDEQNTRSVGTPAYMAPEQLHGRPVKASDIYALGVIAYEMLTGQRPFVTDNMLELAQKQRENDFPKPRRLRPELAVPAEAVILRALAFDQRYRYNNAQEFGDDLARTLEVEEKKSRPTELDFAHALSEKLRSRRARSSQSAVPNPLWLIFSILFLTLTVALAAVIVHRFLGNAPDITSISITLSLGLLCLLVGNVFTRNGQEWVERNFFRFGLKLTFQGKWQMIFTLASALIVSVFYFSLPAIASIYNGRAIELQQAGDLSTALKCYERAVNLNPGYAVARYNLASAYEDVEAFDEALAEYQIAIRADPKLYFAHNNLARLYLLRHKDYGSALKVLSIALGLNPQEPQVKYSLYKNRGWAHFGVGLYDQAVEDLRESLNWRQDGAAAHCLLAQVLEAQKKEDTATPEWEACVAYAAGEVDVEASWLSLARERLGRGGKK